MVKVNMHKIEENSENTGDFTDLEVMVKIFNLATSDSASSYTTPGYNSVFTWMQIIRVAMEYPMTNYNHQRVIQL